MKRLRLSFLGIFALISSCGPAPEAPVDTPPVAVETHAGTRAADAAFAFALVPDALPELVGFSGARFAVLDTTDATIVFDDRTSSAFTIAGHPLRATTTGFDAWADVGLAGNDLPSAVHASADGDRMLVRTDDGIAVVDLAKHGALLASVQGPSRGASIAPDGASFATWSDDEMTVVRISDGGRVAYPFTAQGDAEPALTWTPRTASWVDRTGAMIVERATWRVSTIAMNDASLVASKDGGVIAAFRAGVIEIQRAGETKPVARIATAFVSNVIMDAAGTKVAWLEHSGDSEERAHLHTLDVTTGVHVRFAAKAARCPLYAEQPVAIENGELHTDGECSPGCPSLGSQADLLAYDFASGRVLRHWMGAAEPPFDNERSVRVFAKDQLVERYGLAGQGSLPIVHHPSTDVVMLDGRSGLELADVVSGDSRPPLDDSGLFAATSAHFWPGSGARVIGVREGAIAVWDSATGKRVWSTAP